MRCAEALGADPARATELAKASKAVVPAVAVDVAAVNALKTATSLI